MSDDDFPMPEGEWSWADDLVYGFRVVMIICACVSAFGVLAWMVLK